MPSPWHASSMLGRSHASGRSGPSHASGTPDTPYNSGIQNQLPHATFQPSPAHTMLQTGQRHVSPADELSRSSVEASCSLWCAKQHELLPSKPMHQQLYPGNIGAAEVGLQCSQASAGKPAPPPILADVLTPNIFASSYATCNKPSSSADAAVEHKIRLPTGNQPYPLGLDSADPSGWEPLSTEQVLNLIDGIDHGNDTSTSIGDSCACSVGAARFHEDHVRSPSMSEARLHEDCSPDIVRPAKMAALPMMRSGCSGGLEALEL
mmetsp:Transcript_53521/g.88864  ORF Transcript_53521/g.88864 Transcript_53521/m.88864 type:complete len:264 (+) Transcript_53521:1-792(+)